MKKKTLIAGGLTLSILSGGFVFGANIPTDSVSAASNTSATVEKSETEKEKENEASEQAELKKEVKVPSQDAEKAALNEVDGTVLDTELGDENGTIVYEITIETKDGKQEVKVDATSGEFLKVENDDDEDEENGDDENVEYEDGDQDDEQQESESNDEN
ncbi:PepSY domain-containing protein [Aquibacillus sp. 3ASR75-11]|uniref:PepSY domain-containing protein n=1 Tax=Terrihalobacillus insolitus TaxID=2950438 RepID=A0A9X3WWB5_9BACI|nr:PepSY domain-containing protein [Terrihalobacillus insolitus]MDC3413834.1 PepSY domain-containing protein [Terrihalobacillus insolitus]MDC3424519.1 PepSY domain-containing protein [Terrihalobacillus insolitus]